MSSLAKTRTIIVPSPGGILIDRMTAVVSKKFKGYEQVLEIKSASFGKWYYRCLKHFFTVWRVKKSHVDSSGRNNLFLYLTSSRLMCTQSTSSCAAGGFVTDRRTLLSIASVYCLTFFFFFKMNLENFPDNTSAPITCTSECKTSRGESEDNCIY